MATVDEVPDAGLAPSKDCQLFLGRRFARSHPTRRLGDLLGFVAAERLLQDDDFTEPFVADGSRR